MKKDSIKIKFDKLTVTMYDENSDEKTIWDKEYTYEATPEDILYACDEYGLTDEIYNYLADKMGYSSKDDFENEDFETDYDDDEDMDDDPMDDMTSNYILSHFKEIYEKNKDDLIDILEDMAKDEIIEKFGNEYVYGF